MQSAVTNTSENAGDPPVADRDAIRWPSVAVVMPCFNAAPYLARTIDSILSQDYPNLRIIAVDDGSNDGTLGVLNGYAPRVAVLTHPDGKNRGQSRSTNLGMDRADAELIAFMDADDVLYEGKIRKQVEAFLRHPEVGVVCTGAYAIDPDDRVLYRFPARTSPGRHLPSELLLDCDIVTPSTVMVRKSLVDEVGGFDERIVPGDHDMWLRLSERTRFLFLDEPLVGYRRHPGQISTARGRRMWRDGFAVLAAARRRYPYSAQVVRKRQAVLHYRLGECARDEGKRIEAAWRFLLAALLDPARALRTLVRGGMPAGARRAP